MLTKLPATVVCLLSIWVTALAQTEKVIKIDGDSDFHLGTNTEIAGHLLKPGMYRVKLLTIFETRAQEKAPAITELGVR